MGLQRLLLVGLLASVPATAWSAGPFPVDAQVEYVLNAPHEKTVIWEGATVTLRRTPTDDAASTEPFCQGGGVDAFVVGTPPAGMQALCDQLHTAPPKLTIPQSTDREPPFPARGWPMRLFALGVLIGALSLIRRWEAWATLAVALAVRWFTTTPGTLMGDGYPFLRLADAAGAHHPSWGGGMYGNGWQALMWATRLGIDLPPSFLFIANLGLSSATAALIWIAAWHWTQRPAVAWVAGLVVAVQPLAVSLAMSESMFVACGFLLAAALAGLLRDDLRGAWIAAAAMALASHTRPYQVFAALVVFAMIARRSRGAAAAGLGVAGIRMAQLAWSMWLDGPPTGAMGLGLPLTRLAKVWTTIEHHPVLVVDPWSVPWWLAPCAGIGVWFGPGPRHQRIGLGLLLAALVLPYGTMHRVTDVLRFQLPAMGLWSLLAAAGLAWIWARSHTVVRVGCVLAVVSGLIFARSPRRRPFDHSLEFAAVNHALATLRDGDEVIYGWPEWTSHHHSEWAELEHGIELVSVQDVDPSPGSLVWIGRYQVGEEAVPIAVDCELAWIERLDVVPWNGGLSDEWDDVTMMEVGVARVVACGGP